MLSTLTTHLSLHAELMRLSKPIGILNIFFPFLFGLLYRSRSSHTPSAHLLQHTLTLLTASIFWRGGGCTWNDLIDRDIDAQVSRTRSRPLARGAVKPWQAVISFAAQMLVAAWLMTMLPVQPWDLMAVYVVLIVHYPFAKRYSDYPQVALGVTLALGVPIGSRSLGYSQDSTGAKYAVAWYGEVALALVYLLWSVAHDLVYAAQDKHEDVAVGVGSMAVRFSRSSKGILLGLSAAIVALLVYVGAVLAAGVAYFAFACGGTGALLLAMQTLVDLANPKSCAKWFKMGCLGFGCLVTAGLGTEVMIS